jgi:NAD-dependent dihydropyrimidine dehydrogenase PreA subunit
MAYVIAEPCISVEDTACVGVCPCDCIHPTKNEAEFATAPQLFIHPDGCIDCGASQLARFQQFFLSKICPRSGRNSPPRTQTGTRSKVRKG